MWQVIIAMTARFAPMVGRLCSATFRPLSKVPPTGFFGYESFSR
jgi:hypothetical protein